MNDDEVGKDAFVILLNPAVTELAFQVMEYLSGQPVMVKGIEVEDVPKQIVELVKLIEGPEGPKSQPLLKPVGDPALFHNAALPSKLADQMD